MPPALKARYEGYSTSTLLRSGMHFLELSYTVPITRKKYSENHTLVHIEATWCVMWSREEFLHRWLAYN